MQQGNVIIIMHWKFNVNAKWKRKTTTADRRQRSRHIALRPRLRLRPRHIIPCAVCVHKLIAGDTHKHPKLINGIKTKKKKPKSTHIIITICRQRWKLTAASGKQCFFAASYCSEQRPSIASIASGSSINSIITIIGRKEPWLLLRRRNQCPPLCWGCCCYCCWLCAQPEIAKVSRSSLHSRWIPIPIQIAVSLGSHALYSLHLASVHRNGVIRWWICGESQAPFAQLISGSLWSLG